MDRVGRMKLYNDIPFVTALPQINGNTGSIIGTMFEYNLLQVINEDFLSSEHIENVLNAILYVSTTIFWILK